MFRQHGEESVANGDRGPDAEGSGDRTGLMPVVNAVSSASVKRPYALAYAYVPVRDRAGSGFTRAATEPSWAVANRTEVAPGRYSRMLTRLEALRLLGRPWHLTLTLS
jgi:hypothetical protein